MAQAAYDQLVTSMLADLSAQARVVDLYELYYLAEHKSTSVTPKFQQEFGKSSEWLTSNWCRIVVDAAAGRMRVAGHSFPSLASHAPDEPAGADPSAQQIWEASGMGTWQGPAHTTTVYGGRSYLHTQPPLPGEEWARISVEHPSQTIVRRDPANPSRIVAALKSWHELTPDGNYGDQLITLWTPARTYRLRRIRVNTVAGVWAANAFKPRTGVSTVDEAPTPLGTIPIVPLENKLLLAAAGPSLVGKTLLLGGMSDLHEAVPLQTFIRASMIELRVLGEFTAFPQRWATGLEIPIDPATGEELDREEWAASIAHLWTIENDKAKFGAFPAEDGAGIMNKIEMLVRHMAAQTRTPASSLMLGDMINISADGIIAARSSLDERIAEKLQPVGGGHERAMRLACGLSGDMQRFNDFGCSTLWEDHRLLSEAQKTDSVIKQYQAGLISHSTSLRQLGYSPAEIEREQHLMAFPDRGPTPAQVRAIELAQSTPEGAGAVVPRTLAA